MKNCSVVLNTVTRLNQYLARTDHGNQCGGPQRKVAIGKLATSSLLIAQCQLTIAILSI